MGAYDCTMATPGEPGDPDLVDSPYPELARRRTAGSVLEEPVETNARGHQRCFGAYSWESVRAALTDPALSACPYHDALGLQRRYGEILPGMDPPDHRLHRAILQPVFSRAGVDESLRPTVEAVVDQLVGGLAPRGAADLQAELCGPLPSIVLSRLFGLPDSWSEALRAQALVLTEPDQAPAVRAGDALLRDLGPVIRRRREAPRSSDLISLLAHGTVGHRALTDLEVFAHLRVLAVAGSDTVSRATATTLFALLSHPDQLEAVRADHRLAAAAVDEAIRWECPALAVPRVAARDTTLDGVDIPTGAAVLVHLGAANHDPSRWADPERYDLHRPPQAHAGFGMGPHACLGVHLANLVIGRTVTVVIERLRGVHFDPQAPPAAMGGSGVRAPTSLRVRWA